MTSPAVPSPSRWLVRAVLVTSLVVLAAAAGLVDWGHAQVSAEAWRRRAVVALYGGHFHGDVHHAVEDHQCKCGMITFYDKNDEGY